VDNANDLSPGACRSVKAYPAANDFLSGEMAPGEGLVNNYDAGLVFCVLQIEIASAHKVDAHRLKILWTYDV
jgi:hypothetical protein